ncbi:MAG: GNAT family N-acetyltransferase [Thermoplasmata archaeon]|nr:GNAT family N-acetyltransferase [Thermoplasmata archaeon]MCI4362013.1 GNAT family N-acetyltransferase [Thermoplasmata archaeon]MCI4370142.1 GNAT family N-acetyltransferase [Thermoplasmata archaeon]
MAADGVRPGIDALWLERTARESPVEHAYALWDLVQAPDRTRFVSVVRGGVPRAYLLLWHGHPSSVIAHWVGEADPLLVPALPPPPCVILAPEDAAPLVRARIPGIVGSPTLLMSRKRAVPLPAPTFGVRRLTGRDRGLLPSVTDVDSPMRAGYARMDPAVEPVWGAFEGERLVGVAHASVTLPFAWVIAGVYTRPESRGRGIAQAVTAAICRQAEAVGAVPTLFVREENLPARHAYEKLGFATVGRKVWFEAPDLRVA